VSCDREKTLNTLVQIPAFFTGIKPASDAQIYAIIGTDMYSAEMPFGFVRIIKYALCSEEYQFYITPSAETEMTLP